MYIISVYTKIRYIVLYKDDTCIYIYLYLYSGCFIKLVSEGFKDDPRKQMKFMPDKLPVGKLPSEIRAS